MQNLKKFCLNMDSTEISSFRHCPHEWMLSYRRNLQRRRRKTEGMDKGTVIHSLLDPYYFSIGSGQNKQDSQKYAIDTFKKDAREWKLDREQIFFLITRFSQYCAIYSGNDFIPIVKNGKPAVEIGFSLPLVDNDQFLFVLEGRIDAIVKQQGLIFFVDHKSQSREYEIYDFSIQFMNYSLACGLNRGMINYVGLQKDLKPDEHIRRTPLFFPPNILQRWYKCLVATFFQAAHALLTTSFEQRWEHCGNDGFGRFCQFTKLCEETNQNTREALIQVEYEVKEKWSPWSLPISKQVSETKQILALTIA